LPVVWKGTDREKPKEEEEEEEEAVLIRDCHK